MSSRRKDDLSYGKVGRISYDEDANKWEFDRSLEGGPILHLLYSQVLLKGLLYTPDENEKATSKLERQNHKLPGLTVARIWPTLTAALLFLPGHEQVSEAIERSAADFSSISGASIILTVAAKNTDGDSSTLPVIVFTDGHNGSSVRVCFLDETKFLVSNANDKIEAVSFSTLNSAWWDGPGARIKQIEAQTVDGQSTGLFGVLFSTILCLCRASVIDPESEEETQALEVDCVFAIDVLAIGLQGAAHFAFHSVNTVSLGVIDRNGRWIVGILPSPHSEGSIQWTEPEELSKFQKKPDEKETIGSQDDVWAYVGWPLHGDYLVLGRQSQLAVVNIKSNAFLRLPSLKRKEILVDVQLVGIQNEFIIALTTKSLRLFPTAQFGSALEHGAEEFSIGLSVTHLRDPYYEKIAMACLADGEVIHVLIYGRTSTFASYYRFQPVNGRLVLVDSPRAMTLSETDEIMQPDHFVSVMMLPVKQNGHSAQDSQDLIQLIVLANSRGKMTSKILSTSQRFSSAELSLLTPLPEDPEETQRQNEPTLFQNLSSGKNRKLRRMEKKLQMSVEELDDPEDEEPDDSIPESDTVSRKLAWYLFGWPEERQIPSHEWAEKILSDPSSLFAHTFSDNEKEAIAARRATKSMIEALQDAGQKSAMIESKLDDAQTHQTDAQSTSDGPSQQQTTALSALGFTFTPPKTSEMVDELLMQWIPGNDMSTYDWDAVWTQGGKVASKRDRAGTAKEKRRVEEDARYQLPSSQVVAPPSIREGALQVRSSQGQGQASQSQRGTTLSIRERDPFGRSMGSQSQSQSQAFGASQASSSSQRAKKRKGF